MALVQGDRWIDISVLKTDAGIVILVYILVTRARHMFLFRNTGKEETETPNLMDPVRTFQRSDAGWHSHGHPSPHCLVFDVAFVTR